MDKKMLVIIQAYGIVYIWELYAYLNAEINLASIKHCGHYDKSFGTAVLSFFRVEISIILTQEFNKLHFQECFKIKISSCVCTFSGNTVSWTLVHNASVSRVSHFLVLLLLGVIVIIFYDSGCGAWQKALESRLLESLTEAAGKLLLVHSHWNVTKLKFVSSEL